MKTTKTEVRNAFARFAEALEANGYPTEGLELSEWSPGDGCTRYRVEQYGQEPFGNLYWLGRNEASHALWFASRALEASFDARATGKLPHAVAWAVQRREQRARGEE